MSDIVKILVTVFLTITSIAMGVVAITTGNNAHFFRAVALWVIMLPPMLGHNGLVFDVAAMVASIVWIVTGIQFGEIFGIIIWGVLLIQSSVGVYKRWRYHNI